MNRAEVFHMVHGSTEGLVEALNRRHRNHHRNTWFFPDGSGIQVTGERVVVIQPPPVRRPATPRAALRRAMIRKLDAAITHLARLRTALEGSA